MGATESFRFRSRRLNTDDLNFDVHCSFAVDGENFGPLQVVDLSPTGTAVTPNRELVLAPGTQIDQLKLLYRDAAVWEGKATAVYQVDGPHPRVGLRFDSRLFDLHLLRISDSLIEQRLESTLEHHKRATQNLPSEWRASVAALRRLLEDLKSVLDDADKGLNPAPENYLEEQQAILGRVFEKWGPEFYSHQRQLGRLSSRALQPEDVELARGYATREILPLVYSSPMYRRAYEKPLGYAGDYRLIQMYFGDDYLGESLFARFLQCLAQRYPLGQAVRGRERAMREKVRAAVSLSRPSRVVSLACGPAIELQNLLRELGPIENTIDLVLADQDEQAMHHCHEALSREVINRHQDRRPMIELNCLHISIKQILKPKTTNDEGFLSRSLQDSDLIYASGLFDYLPQAVARVLVRRLYQFLAPGGSLFLANLKACPTSTWIMDYVLAWHLEYRSETSLLNLAKSLKPEPAFSRVVSDDTGYCLFLEVNRPSGS
jgi:extracellular factor (EF) 3-hydroxypalmitic acid methyl ester biosynthesis protein